MTKYKKALLLIVIGRCAITYRYAYFKLDGVFRLVMSIVFLLLFIKTSIEYRRTKNRMKGMIKWI